MTHPWMHGLHVTDLVLEPFAHYDALIEPVRLGQLEGGEAEQLAALLPVAIAQLEAVGDAYGALSLASLQDALGRPEVVAL